MKLRVKEAAAVSILEQSDYYRQVADASLALRWEASVDEAIHSLLNLPERGRPCRLRPEHLSGLRWILVPGFPKHMVFYQVLSDIQVILVVHVLHGARNLEVLLDENL